MRLNGASLAVATCLVLLVTGPAIADDEQGNPNALLKGTYRHMASGSGAGAQTQSLNEPGFEPWPNLAARWAGNAGGHTFFDGVITYDGRGHATETLDGMVVSDGPFIVGDHPVLTFHEVCDWTYEVRQDRSFTREGTCQGITTSAPFLGEPYTLSGLKWVGQIGIERAA